jgi:hypothetical protein
MDIGEVVMKEYEVELIRTTVETYRTKALNKDDAYTNVIEGNAELTETSSIDTDFGRCMEVDEE